VAQAVDAIAAAVNAGGRLVYIGAGTRGRLGVLDASECPPTFGVPSTMVVGLIAGGLDALVNASEGAEDRTEAGASDLRSIGFSARDVLVGIAVSGRTPYVIGALERARALGATTVALTCNPESPIATMADISIAPVVGPEVIAGSSRMKAGTAQKLVLNMLSTATMVRLGLVYSNLMSNLQPNNAKLVRRARAILAEETGLGDDEAAQLFEEAGRDLRIAFVMAATKLPRAEAEALLRAHGNSVRRAIDSL
jgi:N-acetylmuramic acid 6-phosphate etherase